jgi:hypothetical protein
MSHQGAEHVESTLLAVPKVEVFRLPNQAATATDAEAWSEKSVWAGKLVVVQVRYYIRDPFPGGV